MDAIYQADRRIRSGDAEIVVAGGMESMTNAPHLLPGARSGYRIGDGVIVDSMMYDGLERLGVTPLAEIIGYGQVAGPDASLLHQPSRAIKAALDRSDLTVGDIDLFEINEAFAAVGVASADDLGVTMDVVNVNGGAIVVANPAVRSATTFDLRTRGRLRLVSRLRRRRRGP